jgi:hypothetical protein
MVSNFEKCSEILVPTPTLTDLHFPTRPCFSLEGHEAPEPTLRIYACTLRSKAMLA